jgi:hypothetical protein
MMKYFLRRKTLWDFINIRYVCVTVSYCRHVTLTKIMLPDTIRTWEKIFIKFPHVFHG